MSQLEVINPDFIPIVENITWTLDDPMTGGIPGFLNLKMGVYDLEEGKLTGSFEVREEFLGVRGMLDGGATATLADLVSGATFMPYIPVGARVVTVETKINYFKTVKEGLVTAYSKIESLNKEIGVATCRVESGSRLVALSQSTFKVVSVL